MKGLEVSATPFVAQLQSAEVAKPTERSFHDVAGLAQSAAMRTTFSERFQQWSNAQSLHQRGQRRAAVGRIALQNLGLDARSSSRAGNGRHGDDQVERHPAIVQIGWRRFHDQRQTLGFGQHMPLTACFRTIRRIGAGVRPPKTARTLALSMTARSRWIAPALPSVVSNRVWSRDHTERRVQSANRRQQVLPLPQPISVGRSCQGIPVFSTNTMPVSAGRCSTRGRPPLGDRGGRGGSSGSIWCHNSSDTSSAMRLPPCITRRRNSTNSIQVLK